MEEPAITPVSLTVTELSWIILPVVRSNRAIALSVEEAGPETSPPPAGVAHAPSPRQKVEAEALVPLLRFVTGKFPVTPVARDTLVIVLVEPLIEAPATTPASEIVTELSWTSLPVVRSNLTIALSVDDAGPTTSPVPLPVASMVVPVMESPVPTVR
jgi:hypothetical protein